MALRHLEPDSNQGRISINKGENNQQLNLSCYGLPVRCGRCDTFSVDPQAGEVQTVRTDVPNY